MGKGLSEEVDKKVGRKLCNYILIHLKEKSRWAIPYE